MHNFYSEMKAEIESLERREHALELEMARVNAFKEALVMALEMHYAMENEKDEIC